MLKITILIPIITTIILEQPPDIGDFNIKSNMTYDNWPCAKDKAHRRRYEAVLETAPKTY